MSIIKKDVKGCIGRCRYNFVDVFVVACLRVATNLKEKKKGKANNYPEDGSRASPASYARHASRPWEKKDMQVFSPTVQPYLYSPPLIRFLPFLSFFLRHAGHYLLSRNPQIPMTWTSNPC